MIAAVSFEYNGKRRIAFPIEQDSRNDALLFCYQVSPMVGPRSFFFRDMVRIGFTPLAVARDVIVRELQRR